MPFEFISEAIEQTAVFRTVEDRDLRETLQARALLDVLLRAESRLADTLFVVENGTDELQRFITRTGTDRRNEGEVAGEFDEANERLQDIKEIVFQRLQAIASQDQHIEEHADGEQNDLRRID